MANSDPARNTAAGKPPETELKFVVPAYRTSSAIRMLERLCEPDPAFPIGIVSSIYFDSRDWSLLGEKRNSDYLKTKIRLRWYEQPNCEPMRDDASFAEVKSRTGSKRIKTRVPMPYSGAEIAAMELHDRELLGVPLALMAAGAPIHETLMPTFTVRYTRQRFIERATRLRIAIDYAISAPKTNRLMLPNPYPCALESTVLEVKGLDGSFPAGLRNVFKLGFRREAFSKYYECFRHLTRTLF